VVIGGLYKVPGKLRKRKQKEGSEKMYDIDDRGTHNYLGRKKKELWGCSAKDIRERKPNWKNEKEYRCFAVHIYLGKKVWQT